MARQRISTGTPWEAKAGYSRAVKVGGTVYVAGTTASDKAGNVIGVGDPYAQTVYILKKIEAALLEADASLADVVRTRMFVINIDDWEEVSRAHGEVFGEILPAATLVEVNRLVAPEHLVEIEVDAVVGG